MDDIDEASSEEDDTVHRELMDAVVAGDLRRMHAALEEGADVNQEAGDGPPAERYTPLMAACYRGHVQVGVVQRGGVLRERWGRAGGLRGVGCGAT